MRGKTSLIAALAALAAVAPSQASAAGGPVSGYGPAPAGAVSADGKFRYQAIWLGRRTLLARVQTGSGELFGLRLVRGRFELPAVTPDAVPTGLSADGGTLALTSPPPARKGRSTGLLVLDAKRLRVTQRLRLSGWFALDAISPDGSRIYLTQYRSGNPLDYAIREYDVARGRLLARPVVDRREPDEDMRGLPLARVYSPDGRWAYTLYDGGSSGAPFVHALDTVRGVAHCIDLDGLRPVAGLGLRLSPGGGTLTITGRHGPLRAIDTATLGLTPVGAPAESAGERGGSSTAAWLLLVAGAALCALVAWLMMRRGGRPASA